ncbi:hypothetical protein TNCV_2573781 [Trichonephila clavipes]|nr:hypothetical protein TNCV_2573781 [Trichonephila clavipes]
MDKKENRVCFQRDPHPQRRKLRGVLEDREGKDVEQYVYVERIPKARSADPIQLRMAELSCSRTHDFICRAIDLNHDATENWLIELIQVKSVEAQNYSNRAIIDLLKDTFGDRLISRFGPVNWPPRSCDLTPLDYFLWCYVKSLVYADKPQTLDHLEDYIRRVIAADIRPQMLEKVIENWTSRLDYIRAQPWQSYARNPI